MQRGGNELSHSERQESEQMEDDPELIIGGNASHKNSKFIDNYEFIADPMVEEDQVDE